MDDGSLTRWACFFLGIILGAWLLGVSVARGAEPLGHVVLFVGPENGRQLPVILPHGLQYAVPDTGAWRCTAARGTVWNAIIFGTLTCTSSAGATVEIAVQCRRDQQLANSTMILVQPGGARTSVSLGCRWRLQ